MKKWLSISLLLVIAIGLGIGAFFIRGNSDKRSTGGRILRVLKGERPGEQVHNDLAEDLRKIGISQLQQWATDCIDRFGSGKLSADPHKEKYGAGWYKVYVNSSEAPPMIKQVWHDQPNIALWIWPDRPICMELNWGSGCGVFIGPTNYSMQVFDSVSYVAPGIYVWTKP